MSHTLTIAKRELNSIFFSPIAYVVLCLFAFLAGLFFLAFQFRPEQPAEMRVVFAWLVWLLILVVPAISMRLLSEEMRSGTIETMMTSPVSDFVVVIGKWLGAMVFFVILLVPTLFFVLVVELWADPDYGPIVTGYLGLILVGGLYLSIGMLTSALTQNQIIAFLLTVFTILLLTVVPFFLPRFLSADSASIVAYINVNYQYSDFAKGLIDTSNVVYFFCGIVFFLTAATKALESRKWR